ncbi:uncharacterized protein [Littorina saxatilis]|uniref:uncharacterized protein isoform X2 n=1 Tax=Littorina saxatilis TaxID=31220 RepID=UPI0038B4861C
MNRSGAEGVESCQALCRRKYVPRPSLLDVGDQSIKAGTSFSVVSYNILAECHRQKWDYSYTAEEFLVQEYRHALLMKELQQLDGDVVCLQEVNPGYFNDALFPAMRMLGYDGLLKRRTKEEYDEGEATFFKTDLFELDSSRAVSLTEVTWREMERRGLSPDIEMAVNKYLDRADVVLVTRLRCKGSSRVVTVGNVHLCWEDNLHPDVKAVQAACAIKEVVGMAGSDGAHIICGDFNSEWSSPIYQLVLDGYLSDSSIATLQGVQRLELNDGAKKSLVEHYEAAFHHQASNLKSAYASVLPVEMIQQWRSMIPALLSEDYLSCTVLNSLIAR